MTATMKDILNQEIKWHKNNMGTSGNGVDFEKGFIEGLKQAKLLYIKTHRKHGPYELVDAYCQCERCRKARQESK